MPLAKPSAASAAAYGGSVSTSARALDSEEPTYHRPPRIREDSDDFPIPVAASAHIHAAAARAVANGDDAAGADFDAVEHYVSTRPTSGIRPRSGVRTSAVNPALAAVRGPTVQAAPGSRKSPMAVVLSGRGDDDPHDFHSSSKLQEDEPAPPLSRLAASAAVVSVPQPTPVATASHSRRRHNTRPADPLPDVALPSVVPLPAATAITYNAESERLAKLADDGPPVSRVRAAVAPRT